MPRAGAPSGGLTPDRMSAICQAACASSTVPPAAGAASGRFGAVAQRLDLAAIGEAGVELHEVVQRDADAAKADGQAGRFVPRQVPA